MIVVVTLVVLVAVLSFVGGYLLCLRRLPDTLAAMTPEELSVLATRTAARKRFEQAPTARDDFENINERVASAQADVMATARQRALDGRG